MLLFSAALVFMRRIFLKNDSNNPTVKEQFYKALLRVFLGDNKLLKKRLFMRFAR